MYKTFKDRPQKGNPHQLKTNQHVFPVASIDRFYNDKEQVQVWRTGSKAPFPAKSKNPIFCADYVWDERAESGYMKRIEDCYQELIDSFLKQPLQYNFSDEENRLLNEMYGLWEFRHRAKKDPIPASKIKGITGLSQYRTADEQEQLEKSFFLSFLPDRVDNNYPNFSKNNAPDFYMPSRNINGMQIQRSLDVYIENNEGSKWGVFVAEHGEFLVPDNYKWNQVLPVTPSILLVKDRPGIHFVTVYEVAVTNTRTLQASDDFVFARDFNKTPMLKKIFVDVFDAIHRK